MTHDEPEFYPEQDERQAADQVLNEQFVAIMTADKLWNKLLNPKQEKQNG